MENDMATHMKRIRTATPQTRGTRKRTRPMPLKYQNYDLHLFRQMSKISRRVTAQEIDELIRPV
jgi:hypothetical protein